MSWLGILPQVKQLQIKFLFLSSPQQTRTCFKGPTEVNMSTILDFHSEPCTYWMSMYLLNEQQIFSLLHIRLKPCSSCIKVSVKWTYWLQLIQRAHSTCSHIIELYSDFPFWGDACHCAFSKFIMNYLSTQSQATVYATNHSQHCH